MEQEGVIKFNLNYRQTELTVRSVDLKQLNQVRGTLIEAAMLGQHEQRYGGLGFGNLSLRDPADKRQFLVSGTQTGGLSNLCSSHLSCVYRIDVASNQLWARGLSAPSSEALTHGVLYAASEDIQAVVHVHCPGIWYHADALSLPSTPADIAYGSVEMAAAVAALARSLIQDGAPLMVFAMKGHQDGIVAAAEDLNTCLTELLRLQQKSRAINTANSGI